MSARLAGQAAAARKAESPQPFRAGGFGEENPATTYSPTEVTLQYHWR